MEALAHAAAGGEAVPWHRDGVPGLAGAPAARGALGAHPGVLGRVHHLACARRNAGLPEADPAAQDPHEAGEPHELVVVAGVLR